MSYNRTCHLSSLEISEGDEVVLIPVRYGYISHSHLVYGTNNECTIASLPMIGKYNGYGSIDLLKESVSVCDNFRSKINNSLMNNTEYREKIKNSKFNFKENFYLFKRSGYNEVDKTYFYADSDLIQKSKEELDLFSIQEIKDNEYFLSLLSNASLVSVNSRTANRFSFQLIRKDVYDSMVLGLYESKKQRVQEKINKIFSSEWNEETRSDFGQDYIGTGVIELFNSDNYLVNDVMMFITNYLRTKNTSDNGYQSFIDDYKIGMVNWSLICGMYANLGKSFYPNVSKHQEMNDILVLNEIIKKKATE